MYGTSVTSSPLPFSQQNDGAWPTVSMGAGAVLEPLVVIVLLFGGTWINRAVDSPRLSSRKNSWSVRRSTEYSRDTSPDSLESGLVSPTPKDALLTSRSLSPSLLESHEEPWQKRQIGFLSWTINVTSPNTAVFRNRLLSRLLRRFPFLVECWYWALVYWVSSAGTSNLTASITHACQKMLTMMGN